MLFGIENSSSYLAGKATSIFEFIIIITSIAYSVVFSHRAESAFYKGGSEYCCSYNDAGNTQEVRGFCDIFYWTPVQLQVIYN